MAADFIRATSGPLFVVLAPTAPHAPAIPAPRHDGDFAGMAPWRPPSYNEADISDKPEFARTRPLWDATRRATEDAFHEKQLETLLSVDDAVGKLVDALRDTGRLDETLFAFTSDNGLSWGEHRWNSKYVALRGVDPRPAGRSATTRSSTPGAPSRAWRSTSTSPRRSRPVAGVPLRAEGRNLEPLLDRPNGSWRNAFLVEHHGPVRPALLRAAPPCLEVRAVRHRRGGALRPAADPYELDNLAGRPAFRELRHAQRVRCARSADRPRPG